MKVLVAAASRHGSTQEIAYAIAQELSGEGHAVTVRDIEVVERAQRYDAAIVGSAVYMGKWMPEARRFVERNSAWLTTIPVWLFSSGPLGEIPQSGAGPAGMAELVQALQAREHHIFVGKLDRRTLGSVERLIATMVHAPEGDLRDWEAIRTWAHAIARQLRSLVPAGG
jgi:menaquinone-dependent protoporphyrinogen oxidase